jgi:hypothetical protein
MIEPTVGRVVWYRPAAKEAISHDGEQPLAATITFVWDNELVNLSVFDRNGVQHSRTSVMLHQEGSVKPEGRYAEWMPYQVGQAKKHEGSAQ